MKTCNRDCDKCPEWIIVKETTTGNYHTTGVPYQTPDAGFVLPRETGRFKHVCAKYPEICDEWSGEISLRNGEDGRGYFYQYNNIPAEYWSPGISPEIKAKIRHWQDVEYELNQRIYDEAEEVRKRRDSRNRVLSNLIPMFLGLGVIAGGFAATAAGAASVGTLLCFAGGMFVGISVVNLLLMREAA